jgi:hypothetical protein
MKKLTLTLCAIALASAAYAGTETYSGKEMKQVQTPCPTWYGDNEFDLGISGVYAPTANGDDDRLLGDDAWGGAIDLKYFFHRYFGIGIQGFGLALDDNNNNNIRGFNNNNDDFAGGVLGTFTFRYPIPCSRFAPYGWVGAGAVWGGGSDRFFFNNQGVLVRSTNNSDGRFMSQYGIGLEYRFTRHIGWTNDVSYNWVDYGHNDFWQIRTGINFAF